MTFTTDIRLKRDGEDLWKSEDERVEIHHDHTFETECDEPHPVKVRLDKIRSYYATEEGFNRWLAKMTGVYYNGKVKTKRTSEGWIEYLTYQCPGQEPHYYSQWTVRIDGEWTEEVCDTFAEARGVVEHLTGQKTIASPTRKPKAPAAPPETADPVTGRRTWTRCGHPAEYDINMGCYTCHEDPKAS